MLSRIKSFFTQKNRKSNTESRETRNTKTRSILKKPGTTNNKTRKNIRFSSPSRNQIKIYAPDNEPMEPIPSYRKCSSRPRESDFPCQIRGAIFYNIEEFNEYARLVNDKNKGRLPAYMHYANMKKTLKSSGSYKKKIPPQYRYYDEETGEIHDIRLFNDDDSDE